MKRRMLRGKERERVLTSFFHEDHKGSSLKESECDFRIRILEKQRHDTKAEKYNIFTNHEKL